MTSLHSSLESISIVQVSRLSERAHVGGSTPRYKQRIQNVRLYGINVILLLGKVRRYECKELNELKADGGCCVENSIFDISIFSLSLRMFESNKMTVHAVQK